MTRILLTFIPLLVAAGCAEPMIPDSDVIRHAAEPAYSYDEGGRLMATACRPDRPSLYSGTPSACQRDVVFAHPGFLVQFAQGCGAQVFAFVDPALRHLPGIAFAVVDPLADEDETVGVDEHDADAGPVGQAGKIAHM